MVAVAIIGILSTVAIVGLSGKRHGRTAYAFAHQVSSVLELARLRAIATHKRQRVSITANSISHLQRTVQGMDTPDSTETWDVMRQLSTPTDIEIASLAAKTHINNNDTVPAVGTGMTGAKIDFLPDGSSEASTVFIRDVNDTQFSRVAVYGLSGTSYVFSDW